MSQKYLVDYDTNGARAYFDVYKEEEDFSERNTIEGKIAKGEMVTWAQEEAERLLASLGMTMNGLPWSIYVNLKAPRKIC